MDEDLDLHRGPGAQILNGGPGQLPGQHHPGHPQVCAGLDAVQVVDGHLGGGVKVHVGNGVPQEPGHPQVLNQDGVHPGVGGKGRSLGGQGQLPVGQEGVQRQVDLGSPQVAVCYPPGQVLQGKILCVAAGV